MEFGTGFSNLKIVRTAITYSTKKCDVLVSLGTYPDNRECYINFTMVLIGNLNSNQ